MNDTTPDAGLDDFFERLSGHNPFLDNRINNPSARDVDVAEIHQAAFDQLTGLARQALAARRGVGVVLWGEAGIGKSHLLSRLARWAAGDGGACLAYLHNLQAAPERLPRALLRSVVGLLTNGRAGGWHATPLYDLLRAGLLGTVGGVEKWPSWEALHRAYGRRLDGLGAADLPGAAPLDRDVSEALFRFFQSAYDAARGREDGATAALAPRWLSGDALDPEEAARLGLRPAAAGEAVALADGQQVKQALVALSRLAAAAGRPFVLAFDQVDNLDDEQFAALSRFLEALIDASPNLLAVTAGIQPTLMRWREAGVIQHSAWDRLAQFEAHLQRLTAGQALRLVRARLDDFLRPFAGREAIRRRLEADPLFPLGEGWRRQAFQDKVDLRPRDVINWAREGWRRRQEDLARRGGPAWLAAWTAGVGADGAAEAWTEDEERRAIDRAVDGVVTLRARAARDEPHTLPPDADRIAALAYDLLCQSRRPAGPQVRRLPPPRRGARPAYDLDIIHPEMGETPGARTGVLFLTAAGATSAAGFLRRLSEGAAPLRRLFLVTDERVRLSLGETGARLLRQLQERPGLQFEQRELSVAELAELDALHAAVLLARSGDLEAEVRPGRARRVTEREVVESHQRRGRYAACRLLHDLLAPPAATVESSPAQTVTDVATR